MRVDKKLREWVEEMHQKIHLLTDGKKADHKAGYYDWLAGLSVKKILEDVNHNESNLINLRNEIVDLDNKLKDIEYKMDSFKEMAEEILSRDAKELN